MRPGHSKGWPSAFHEPSQSLRARLAKWKKAPDYESGDWEFDSLGGRRWVLVKWYHGCLQNSRQGFDSPAPCQLVSTATTRCVSSRGRASPCPGEGSGIKTRTHRHTSRGAISTAALLRSICGPPAGSPRSWLSDEFNATLVSKGTERGRHCLRWSVQNFCDFTS